MAVKIQHLRSSTASKRPTTAALLDGELSINTNSGTSGVFFKDSAGTSVIKVGPAEVGSSAPNATPASGGSAGNSVGEFWLDTANAGGNGQRALKIYDGSTWQYAGSVTLGSTNVQLGATTSSLSGLTGVTSGTFTATTGASLNNQSYLRFYEATANGTNYVGFQAPAAISTDLIWTLPSADGSNGQVLQTNGSGVLTWASFSGSSISQANSSVAVSDTGTNGTITFTTDGSSRWAINSDGHLVPSTDSAYNIGASGTEVNSIWVDTLNCQTAANLNGSVTLGDATTDTITFTGRASSSLLPAATNTYTLGSASNLWNEVRATNLYGTIQTASQTNITGVGTIIAGVWSSVLDGERFSTNGSVSAGGDAQGQSPLTSDFNVITLTAASPSGVTLPAADVSVGRRIFIVNRGTNPVNVYPSSGVSIDSLATNASIQIPVNGVMFFNGASAFKWYSSSFLSAANGAVTSFSGGTTGLTPSTSTTGTVTLGGTLSVANGGTGQTSYTNGQLLIGNSTGNTLTKGTLTPSTGISVTNGPGTITLGVTGDVVTSISTGSGSVTPFFNSFTLAGGTGISTSGVGSTASIALTDTGVSAGSYGSPSSVATFTVNAKGQLTAAATASISITASQVSNFDTQVRTSRLDQMAAPTGPVSFNSQRITDVATPLLPTDAATKAYADSIAQSLNVHGAVDYATTGAVSYTYTSGGTSLTITTITGTDTITFSANHGLSLNSQIRTGDTTTGTGLTANTTYYVTAIPATNQVKVSSTYGGANATLTNGTGLSIGVTGDPGIGATLSGCPNTIDSGSTLTIGQRILVKDHTTAAYNGVFAVTTVGTGANGVWTRTTDFDNGPTGEITAGDYIFVASGTINGSNGFVQTSPPPVRMGKSGAGYTTFTGDSISFTQFSGAGQITAGNGLTKSGNTLDVNPDSRASGTKTIAIVSDEVRIDTAWTGQTSLTTLGTITTGTWNATAIGLAYGGTGQSNTNITSRHVFMGPAGTNGNAAFREFTTADVNPTTNGSFDAGVY